LAIAIWLKAFKATGNWWTRAQLPNGAWVEHGPSLSRMLSDRQWRDIAPVFTGVAQWNGVSSATRAVYRTRETIPFKCFPDIATLRDTLLDGAETAIQTLQTFALPETEDPTEFSKIVSSPLTSNSMSVIEQVKFAATDPVLRTLTVVGITWYLRQHVLRKQT
jgi:hypothetical protein